MEESKHDIENLDLASTVEFGHKGTHSSAAVGEHTGIGFTKIPFSIFGKIFSKPTKHIRFRKMSRETQNFVTFSRKFHDNMNFSHMYFREDLQDNKIARKCCKQYILANISAKTLCHHKNIFQNGPFFHLLLTSFAFCYNLKELAGATIHTKTFAKIQKRKFSLDPILCFYPEYWKPS
jgi:hypothetical protein